MKNINSLPRIFIPSENLNGEGFSIPDPDDIHKLRQVLRLSIGDKIRIFDGEGGDFLGVIDSLDKKNITGHIEEKIEIKVVEKPHIILAQALTRSQKLEEIIKMNTEIGVDEFVFFESDHSIVKIKDFKESIFERFDKIVLEASRQSERAFAPKISNKVLKFEELANIETERKAFLFERDSETISDNKKFTEGINNKSTILVIVGPEGGFSNREVEFAKKNFELVHLNLPVLRTETAGIALCSFLLINSEFCNTGK